MYQDFSDDGAQAPTIERLQQLRSAIAALDLDGFIVPRADEHQGEYVPPNAERLRWLTGFSGSAGTAIVLAERAALFIDGRYVVQASQQVDQSAFECLEVPQKRISKWLREALDCTGAGGWRIGFDSKLHTIAWFDAQVKMLASHGIELVPLRQNPIDALWSNPPAFVPSKIARHGLRYAGKRVEEKLAAIQQALNEEGEAAVVLTLPDSICWLFNARGNDVPHTPLILSYAIVFADEKPAWFVDAGRLSEDVKSALAPLVEIYAPDRFYDHLKRLNRFGETPIRLDPGWTSYRILEDVEAAGAQVSRRPDPCIAAKARKNGTELAGARAAHIRDGAGVTRFLAWLDRQAPGPLLDEIATAKKLEEFRRDTGQLKEISFDTISAAGPNGAMPHYRVTEASNRPLDQNSLYLVDSGGQYLDGTTDITRVIAIGVPPREMRERFTLVLKGMIAITLLRFPCGTTGGQIDGFARHALWQAGLDFDHGTGHGVGSYLSVHEGPQSISKRGAVELEPGMIVSNEPGYYKQGHYGIRIENLLVVTEPSPIEGGERDMLGFETLTLAPIDRRLIDCGLLTNEERNWLDSYHVRVRDALAERLSPEDGAWLRQATEPL